ncbi:MAG: septum formation protein Maf [Flavobacteriales bacterium]|nr:septum formation protein Maf [Flavobacteriales bacterium]
MLDNLDHKRIILASQSPRRHMLLKGLDLDFDIEVREIEEVYPESLEVEKVAGYLADLKAQAWEGEIQNDTIVITSDTVVLFDGKILGKPQTPEEGIAMLRQMSGKQHTVITGVCLATNSGRKTFSDHTQVTFSTMTDAEIEYYVEKYRPLDKAGSYGAQEFIGYIGIEKLEGSYFNVMGLPVHRLWQELKALV